MSSYLKQLLFDGPFDYFSSRSMRKKIMNFEFESSFATRLRKETGWGAAKTHAAIFEYRKFLFLTTRTKEVLIPSSVVEKVWESHLEYSKSYWEGLCGQILGFALHHKPTAGVGTECSAYMRTLSLYRSNFGEVPESIWESPKERFPGLTAPVTTTLPVAPVKNSLTATKSSDSSKRRSSESGSACSSDPLPFDFSSASDSKSCADSSPSSHACVDSGYSSHSSGHSSHDSGSSHSSCSSHSCSSSSCSSSSCGSSCGGGD